MPYIEQEKRRMYEPELSSLKDKLDVESKGDLTYLVFCLGLEYFNRKGVSYTSISNAISCLTDAAEEIRRKHLIPYENLKIKENGDIYR